ncbi:hypothetical protein BCR32DRAFT_271175 [Anaeromyces robustus]|uniref:Guanylate cyclase domain-containing protein n=1 Tax=Anaeromyces robustus TaxID=1754192 RepID=A0A1Y1WSV8_9FUNG|nr:hypothetical protein BCR32DRAFT_271175 [Anaeromyces robustus]|eukprot:ORX76630.1 hypothetical protein BCR32DRAFT_271175 [Anaeromyces robustus]
MDIPSSLPTKGNFSLLQNDIDSMDTGIMKSTSMNLNKNNNNDDEEEEDVPIKMFGQIKNSIENLKKSNSNDSLESNSSNNLNNESNENNENNDNGLSKEEELKIEHEYEKVLKAFLPFHLQNYLENLDDDEADTLQTSSLETFCVIAVIGIADIVSFLNQIQSKGTTGMIYLKENINKYFCEVIEFITENKGDILNITDNAIIVCWTINENDFEVDECSRGDLTLDAIKTCLKLIEQYGKHTFECEDCKLDYVINIGLDSGINSVLLIEIEKEHLWQYINEGPILSQAYSVLNNNTPGKLGISHQALKWLSIIIDIPSLNLNSYDKKCIIVDNLDNIIRKVAELSDESEDESEESIELVEKIERLAMFVNDDLVYRFQACFYEIPKYHEEIKVSTLIIKTEELPLETTEDIKTLQKIFNLMIKTLTKYEGILNNFYTENKNMVFECIFGAPPFVHENDALYAVEAAIEIAGFLRRLLNCYCMSITTGTVWYTGLGNNNYGRFFQIGESVDQAFKIFNSPRSKYSILCDEATYSLTETFINFVNTGVIKYQSNNKQLTKKLYIVINMKKHVSLTPALSSLNDNEYDKNDYNLVGKGYQWNLCASLLKKFVHSGKRRILVIQGEEGYGITPFIRSFEKKAVEEGCSVCIGKISDNTTLNPFAIYEALLREVIKVIINEKRKQERQRRRRNLESLMEENELDENSSKSKNNLALPVINNFKMIGRKSALKKAYGARRSALRNGKMKKSSSSTVSFDTSVVNSVEPEPEIDNSALKSGDKKKIKKRATFIDDQESMITNNTNIKNINGNTFEEDILEALFYLDEREEIAPLLNIIFYNRFESTNEVKIINKRMVFYEFCNLICRLLTKLSFITPLVIILDNAHLQDYYSWKLTNMIFKKCTKLFLCICSRPKSYYNSPEIKSITKEIWDNLNTTVVSLDSLSEADTQKFLTLYYNEIKKLKYVKNKCAKVNNDIVYNLWKLTKGNPLFMLRIANSLFDDSISSLNDDYNLILKGSFNDLELSKNCESMKQFLSYQIKSLDKQFKDFLFISSLINKKVFSFDSINVFVNTYKDENEICKSVYNFINQENLNYNMYDKYQYLKKYYKFKKGERNGEDDSMESKNSSYTNLSLNTNFKSLAGNEDLPIGIDNNNYDVIFTFNSNLIKEVIYESESIEVRLSLHTMYAQFIENNDKDNYFTLYYHYCNTENKEKMIYYLHQLCHTMYKMGASSMASEAYELLLSYYGENIEPNNNNNNNGNNNDNNEINMFLLPRKTMKNPKETIKFSPKPSNFELARMFYELGSCYFGLAKFKNSELYLLKTLDYLEYKFPEKNVSLVVKLIKETKKREQYKKLSEKDKYDLKKEEIERIKKLIDKIKNDSNKEKIKVKYKESLESGSLSLCQKALYIIHEIYNIHHKSIHSQIALLMALNDPSSLETSFKYAEIIARYGLELIWVYSTNTTGWSYLNQAEDIINPERKEIPILKMTRSHLIVYDALAIANIFLKSWSKGKHYLDIIIKLSQQTGDTEIWGRATILKSMLYFQTGAIDKSFRLAKEVYNNSSERNIWKSQCTALLVTLQYFGVKEASDNIFTPLNVINIVFNLPSKLNSSNNEDVVLYVGLIMDACFRFKVPVPNIFDYIKKAISSLDKIEPSCYYSVFSYPQYVISLFLLYEMGYFKKTHPQYEVVNQLLNSTLQAMDLFKETQIVQPLISMLKGLSYLIQGNNNNAMVSWENGAKRAKRSQFYGSMLYWKIAYYGTGEIADRSKIIVKKLLDKINASFDLDIINEWKADTFKIIKARKG